MDILGSLAITALLGVLLYLLRILSRIIAEKTRPFKKPIRLEIKNDWEVVAAILFLGFTAWLLFGGLLENSKSTTTIDVDCRDPGYAASPYCNGEDTQQDYNENSYYQAVAR